MFNNDTHNACECAVCHALQGFNEALVKALAAWVADEYAQGLQKEVDTSTWTLDAPPAPQQHNGCDCGMFMLAYAEHLVR